MKITDAKRTLCFFIGLFLMSSFVLGWTPPSDIDLRNFYVIKNATTINATTFYQNGSLVLDESSTVSTANSTTYWANVTTYQTRWLYNATATLTFNETRMNATIDSIVQDANTSMKTYVDATFINQSDESDLNVNSSNSTTFWSSVSSFFARWFYDDGDVLTFNETRMNATIDSIVQDANTSMKTYVDAEIVSANTSMKTYVDAEITDANTSMKTYVDAEITDANTSMKTYVDAEITDANTSMKTYVDAEITDANTSMKTYVDAEITDANTSMKTYVDAEITDANTSMKTYVDSTFISDVVNDSSPTLGGDLNADSNEIQKIGNITFNTDFDNHTMYDNATCIIIIGDTSQLEIC